MVQSVLFRSVLPRSMLVRPVSGVAALMGGALGLLLGLLCLIGGWGGPAPSPVALSCVVLAAAALSIAVAILAAAVWPGPNGPADANGLAGSAGPDIQPWDPRGGVGRAWPRRGVVDELTGLPGRRYFLDVASRCLTGGEHRARGATSVSVLLIDLDRMRDVNGALGHEHGDRLLATVGCRLRGALPGSDLLARVDGNAFAVLLRGADVARAEQVARRLREVLELPVPLAGTPVRPEASVGIAHAPEHGRGALELFRHAEEAMYLAKGGRHGQTVYARDHPPINRARLLLRAEVRHALDSGQIELSYQPKADLRSGRISGVEALVRWRHPVDGVRQPDAFLAEIERAGLMPKLTVQVLDQALADCARWHGRGAPLAVSVNVPASVIVDRAFVGVVRAALARHRLPPSALVIEVTEDSLIVARELAQGTLAGLRRFGVRVSLDDYGTGFCSLSYLRELPADEVKLDRTFLRDLDRDPAAAEIVRSTVSLAHALRLRIVAEGVETQRSWTSLAAWQCDEVQGYFVSRPMAGERVVGWLREWGSRLAVHPGTAPRAVAGPVDTCAAQSPISPIVAPAVEAVAPTRPSAAGPATRRAVGRRVPADLAAS
ncbi:diguanylate cyclase/phosphodiesterase [Frankia casuarinae]|uniref:Diguanylate cyclase/phosphodiesterase n=2 Tax=Frankia casuarinae (strain DSM 45818 / CECT 9043 / HFP020203 / CcI3) TaxID=106370 RepID=Q2JDH7_FRACC|nr:MULTISPECIES: bifunctional diguanylate cyclase/phosphodiesterase [Frankia]ABD10665.1 diguanylate cyclase/phosphodiesterase [Frankia casuarinae]ETA02931.1 diguanylate cyclase/phosphodiesterase [Frankia sp. CcI6]EYT93421.1 diguanylate cyclase/phosphodiesterase [Frankia casuarinae]KDA43541.1 diguanylate cyclase/phosphodiesterase [Frankia sp. BMG5.23]